MQSPLTWGAAVLVFAFFWVINSPSPNGGFATIAGIGTDIDAALAIPDDQWQRFPRSQSLGYSTEDRWLHWQIVDTDAELVTIHNAWLDNFTLYFVRDAKVIGSHTSGGNHPLETRPVQHSQFVFPIPENPRPTDVYIIDSNSTASVLYPLSFVTWDELIEHAGLLHLLHGIFYGIVAIMLVYNAVIYFSVGDRAYLYLVLYAIALTALIATSDGFGHLYLWFAATWIQNKLVSLALAGVVVFIGLFCMEYLDTRKHLPRLSRLLYSIQLITVVNTSIIIFVDNEFNAILEPIILLSFALTLIVIGTCRALQGSEAGQIFLAANGVVCLFGSIVALTHLGWIPDSAVGRQGALIGAALELALLSIALARRLKRQERLQELLREQTSELTNQVEQLKAASDLAEEHRQLQRSMQHQQKLKTIGQMAGGIAHDFNNILATILGFTELAQENPGDRDKQTRYLDEIRNAGRRGAELVKQLITYSRGDQRATGKLNLNDAVREAATLLRGSLPTTINVQTTLPSSHLQTVLDATQLKQVLVNLALNASEAMANRGTLTLSLRKNTVDHQQCSSCLTRFTGEYAVIRVDDAGDGFEGRAYELFTPFFTTKPVGRGSGLGLSVVHGIVHEYNGHIVAANRPGGGSRFEVYLPLEAPVPVRERTREHILLIEDDPSMARYLETLLEEQSYQVTAVTLPTTALEKFMAAPDDYDLVITDQIMPHGTGMELAQDMLELKPGLPIILTTASADLISEERAGQSGIRAVFGKPISSELLLRRVNSLLHGTG